MKRTWTVFLSMLLFVGCFLGGVGCSKKQKERTRYEIVAEYKPSDHAIAGTVKVDFYNAYDTEFVCLKFQLYPNAYRENSYLSPIGYDVMTEAYYDGQSYGEINVSSVVGASNFEIGGEDKNILLAYLPKPLAPQERVVLDIGFTTRLAKVNHWIGETTQTVNFAGVFPLLCGVMDGEFYECAPSDVGTPLFANVADVTLRLTLPKEYTLACPAVSVQEEVLETKKRHTMSLVNTRDISFCISQEYKISKRETGKTQVRFYHFGETDAEEVAELACRAVQFFSSSFGEYPYEALTIAETGMVRTAFDQAGLCMVPERALGEERVISLLSSIASQWWYSGVGVNRVEHAWLVEGLSVYSVALFLEEYPEYGATKKEFLERAKAEYLKYKDAYLKAFGWVDARIDRPLGEFINTYEYDSIVKNKAVVMLSELEKGIGRKKLLAGLRKYYSQNVYGVATPAHLVGAFEKIGVNVGGFFEGYLNGKGTF